MRAEPKAFHAARRAAWDELSVEVKLARAMTSLRYAMAVRGYPADAVPRVQVMLLSKFGDCRIYVIVLRNQGRQRRRGVYISAMNLDALTRKVAFKNWTQLSGTRMEARTE